MVTSRTLRREYPDTITNWSVPRCDFSDTVPVVFYAGGPNYPDGRVVLRVLKVARQAFRAQAAVMLHHGYTFRETAGGTLNCRFIGGTSVVSNHALGIAKDDNPSKNRYRVQVGPVQFGKQTDMPAAMVRDLEALRTVSGHRLLQWGGRWSNIKDPMHWELECLRANLRTGVNLATLPPGAWTAYLAFEKGSPATIGEEVLYGLDIGTTGKPSLGDAPAHRVLQAFLVRQGQDIGEWGPNGDGVDGRPGDDTRAGLHRWKISAGVTAELSAGEGKIGDYEMAAIYAAGGASGTIDQAARDAAADAAKKADGARTVANRAEDKADRANRSLDKIRSE